MLPFFLVFYNPFMILFHILRSSLDHESMLDNFLIQSGVFSYHSFVKRTELCRIELSRSKVENIHLKLSNQCVITYQHDCCRFVD